MGDQYDPWRDLAGRPHLTFAIARLPTGHGWYLEDVPGIVLDDRLSRVERRCVMAHELAHVDLGHHDQAAGNGPGTSRIARRREREADELAAHRLLDLRRLADALAWALCPEEVADELDVTVDVVRRRIRNLTPEDKAFIESKHWGRTA